MTGQLNYYSANALGPELFIVVHSFAAWYLVVTAIPGVQTCKMKFAAAKVATAKVVNEAKRRTRKGNPSVLSCLVLP